MSPFAPPPCKAGPGAERRLSKSLQAGLSSAGNYHPCSDVGQRGHWEGVKDAVGGGACLWDGAWVDGGGEECIPGRGVLGTGKNMICVGPGGAEWN